MRNEEIGWHINLKSLSIKVVIQTNGNEEEFFLIVFNNPVLPVDTIKIN